MPAPKTQPATSLRADAGSLALAAARESHQKLPAVNAPAARTPRAPEGPASHAAGSASAATAIAVSVVTRRRRSLVIRVIQCPLGGLRRSKEVHEPGGDPEQEPDQRQPRSGSEPSVSVIPGAQPEDGGDHHRHADRGDLPERFPARIPPRRHVKK